MASTNNKAIRVLLARSILDCHQRGVLTVAAALRDAGMEVVYVRYKSVEEVVNTAIQEDVDVIGFSFLAFGQMTDTPKVMKLLKERGKQDVAVILGGVIRKEQVQPLRDMGVRGIFGLGSPTTEIVECVRSLCPAAAAVR